MSSPIWTPAALWSERRAWRGECWRVVEAQHLVSTVALVDTLAEQALLEELIEGSKPPLPAECRGLSYLLVAPFRYGAPYPKGSRFRRAGRTPGVYYASENPKAAIAEMAFLRLLFFAESPDTPWPDNAAEFTAFAAAIRTKAMLDLTVPPLVRDRKRWTDPADYAACQQLAEDFSAAGGEVIRSQSVRAPDEGANIAVLTCRAFAGPEPTKRTTWRLHFGAAGVRAICEFPRDGVEFGRAAFADDPRIARLNWDRA